MSAPIRSSLKPEWTFAASPALLQRGCVNLIGLQDIKFAAGIRWDKMRESIYSQLERILRQKLGPSDFFIQIDEVTFLISTPSATMEEAQIYCVRAAYELHTSLLGRCELSQLRIARAERLIGDVLECAVADEAELSNIAQRAGLPGQNGSQLAEYIKPAQPISKAAENVHRFHPVWDTQNEAITSYRCVTVIDPIPAAGESRQSRFRSDLTTMLGRVRCATDSLARHLADGERFLVSVPISYELIGSPLARMELTTFFRAQSSALRPYLLFEISDLPYGVPQSRLCELVGSLRPFCRGVIAHLPARIPSYSAYMGAGVYAIGVSLSPSSVGTTEMESEVFKLCAAARRLRIKSCVMDVPNLEALISAKNQGVSMISGPCVGSALVEPAPIRRLYLRDIIAENQNVAAISTGPELRTGTMS